MAEGRVVSLPRALESFLKVKSTEYKVQSAKYKVRSPSMRCLRIASSPHHPEGRERAATSYCYSLLLTTTCYLYKECLFASTTRRDESALLRREFAKDVTLTNALPTFRGQMEVLYDEAAGGKSTVVSST